MPSNLRSPTPPQWPGRGPCAPSFRSAGPKEDAKGAGKTGVAVAPGATAKDGTGQSKQGQSSQIKVTQGKSSMPKAGSVPKALAKAERDAKILAETLKEGE